MAEKREILVLLAICTLAACVRLLFLASWAGTPLFHVLIGDELNFHQTALALIGPETRLEPFLYQPLYSFFLAVAYVLIGVDPAGVRTLQLVLGIAGVLVFYGLGRELGGRAVGRLTALVISVYGPLVFFEGHLLAPVLVIPLTAGGLWCLLAAGKRNRSWLLVPAGVLVGLAIMGRPNLAVLLPVGLVWLLLRPWSWKRRIASAGLALTGLLVGLSPSMVHNALHGGGLVPISTAGGISFYLGSNPQANGRFHMPRGQHIDASSHQAYRRTLRLVAERNLGRQLDPSEVSSYWLGRGFEFWSEHPRRAILLSGKKLLLAINSQEMPIHHPYDFGREVASVLRFLPTFGVLFAFAMLGLFLAGRGRTGPVLLLACGAAYLVTLVTFYVSDRYRIALVPMLAPLAALGIVQLYRLFRFRGLRGTWPWLAVLLVAFGATQLPLTSAAERRSILAAGFNRMGKAEGDRGDTGRAEVYFRRSIELSGQGRGALARINLGIILARRGEYDEAERLYQEAAEAEPGSAAPRVMLARLCERLGRLRQAIEWWRQAAERMADPAPARREIGRLQARLDVVEVEPGPTGEP